MTKRLVNKRTKTTKRQRDEIYFLRYHGVPLRALSERYGVHNTTISGATIERLRRGEKPKIKMRLPREFRERDADLFPVGLIKTEKGWRTIFGGLTDG